MFARLILITVFALSVSLQIAGQSCVMCSDSTTGSDETLMVDPHAHHQLAAQLEIAAESITDCCFSSNGCDLGLSIFVIESATGLSSHGLNVDHGPKAAISQMDSRADAPLLRPPIYS